MLKALVVSNRKKHRMALASFPSRSAPVRVRFWHTPAWQKWLGPCASLLCLVHCFSLPFILLLAPGLLQIVPYNFLHDFELVFWILAVELGIFTLAKAAVPVAWQRAFVVLSILAPIGTFMYSPLVTHLTFVAMAVVQFTLVFIVHARAHGGENAPVCCEGHEH
ncbi:MAG: hypothetical protein ABIR96_10385 [Bdellovibrionota bacterium]